MSLEERIAALTKAIEANTKAIEANTEAMLAATSSAGAVAKVTEKEEVAEKAPAKAKAPAKDKAPAKPGRTRAEMNAAVNEVKEIFGTSRAKKLIADAGFAKLAEVTEDKYEELYNAAKALIEEAEESDDAGDL